MAITGRRQVVEVLHDCDVQWDFTPEGVSVVKVKWTCPECGQRWWLTERGRNGEGRRIGKASKAWRRAQVALIEGKV